MFTSEHSLLQRSKWSNILRKFYVTMFTPEHSLLRRSTPLQPPGQPPNSARLPTLPASECLHQNVNAVLIIVLFLEIS